MYFVIERFYRLWRTRGGGEYRRETFHVYGPMDEDEAHRFFDERVKTAVELKIDKEIYLVKTVDSYKGG